MNRSILYILFAAALLMAVPQAEARKGYRGKSRVSSKSKSTRARTGVKKSTPRTRVRLRGTTRRRIKAPAKQSVKRKSTRRVKPASSWASRKASKARLTSSKRRTVKRRTSTSRRRVVRISLKRLNKRDRSQVMGLMMSKRVRSSKAARALIGEYVRLRSLKGGALPLSIKDLKQMTSSSRWSSKRMGNLAKVLRLANYIAKRDKISGKAAFVKALKAAGVYKKYNSGKCGV